MPDRSRKILLIEDNPAYIRLVRELLQESGALKFDLEWAGLLEKGLERLNAGGVDVILLDLLLPDNMGPDTLRRVVDAVPDVPVIVLTGVDDEGLAQEAVELGARDYLFKGRLDADILARSIRQATQRPAPTAHDAVGDKRDLLARITPELAERLDHMALHRDRLAAAIQDEDRPSLQAPLDDLSSWLTSTRRICDGLRELATLDPARGDQASLRSPVSLESALDQALLRLQHRLPEGTRITRYPLPVVEGDEPQLTQLFEHALLGASRLAGGAEIAFEIACEHHGGTWQIVVEHDGPWPEVSDQAELFEPFSVQVDGEPSAPDPGLELSLAAAIVERHGGSIRAEPITADHGIALVIDLPFTEIDMLPPDPAGEQRSERA